MTDELRTSSTQRLRWRATPVLAMGMLGVTILVIAGISFSRPDLIGIALAPALSTAWLLWRRPVSQTFEVTIRLRADPDAPDVAVLGSVDIAIDADGVQLVVDQAERRAAVVDAAPGADIVRTRSLIRHSGPAELVQVTARGVSADGAWVSETAEPVAQMWNAVPPTRRLSGLPVAARLTGLHGAHEGARPGQGGDFRDIRAFVPGDELRRVDWRATARAARRPGDLLVRRDDALSDSSVVVAVDAVEELGEIVASWGKADPERTGVTSLDFAREAALSIATSAIATGDRVGYHALAPGGRSVPPGGGPRHLARLRDVISATGVGDGTSRYRRMPAVPAGAIVFVLSTFFDGAAASLATRWRAAGHAVVAVDVLPETDDTRLTREQRIALRTLLLERAEILAELRRAGIEVVSWASPDIDADMRVAALNQRRARTVRR